MAKCPSCGKIWFCKYPDDIHAHFADDEDRELDDMYVHCTKCKCPDCRKPGDRMTIEEEYYGKRNYNT